MLLKRQMIIVSDAHHLNVTSTDMSIIRGFWDLLPDADSRLCNIYRI